MHPHVHLAMALSVGCLLNLQLEQMFIFVTSSTVLDLDILASSLAREKNHRMLPSHWISVWIGVVFVGLFFGPALWIGLGGLLHVLLDLPDWGIPALAPITMKLSPHLLPDPPKDGVYSQKWFIKRYYENKIIAGAEILSIVLLIVILLSRL
ncbi:MAG: hypothetical protein ACXACI_01225 [Candidatus Hodarchaeales archaeon]|jgi:hypothetical protein